MTCNKTDFEFDNSYIAYNKFTLYLSDDDINDIESLIIGAEGAAAVYEGLVARGIVAASLPAGVGLILGGLLLIAYARIRWNNEGCGVKIVWHVVGATPVWTSVNPQ